MTATEAYDKANQLIELGRWDMITVDWDFLINLRSFCHETGEDPKEEDVEKLNKIYKTFIG